MTTITNASTVIRPARPDDLQSVTEIYGEHVRTGLASFELVAPDLAETRRRWEAARARGLAFLIAEAGGTVAGFAQLTLYRVRPAYGWTVEDSVYVAPEYQRRGIGRRLLTALIEEAESKGFRQMIAVVGDSANRPSLRLHETMGFRHVGVLKDVGFKHGRWVDTVLMQRPLGPGGDRPPGNASDAHYG